MCCDTCTWDAWQHEPSSALHASTAHIVVVFMRAAHTALAHVLGCKCCGYEPAESSGGMNALGWRHRSAAAAGLQVQLKACTTTALQAPPGVPLPVIWRRAAQMARREVCRVTGGSQNVSVLAVAVAETKIVGNFIYGLLSESDQGARHATGVTGRKHSSKARTSARAPLHLSPHF